MKKVVFYYFTGTGNTLRCLTLISTLMEQRGWSTLLVPVNGGISSVPQSGCDLLVLGFPALGFSAPTLVLRRLKELPLGGGCPAVVLCTVGSIWSKMGIIRGWSGTAVFKAARMLSHRGFSVSGSADISYPENWTQMSNPPAPDICVEMIRKGDEEALNAGNKLAAGTLEMLRRTWGRRFFGSVAVLFRILGRVLLVRTFSVDGTCTGCGLCAARCPADSLIMKAGRPWWKSSCTECNRCINLCPSHSIQTSVLRLILVLGGNLAAALLAWPVAGKLLGFFLPGGTGLPYGILKVLMGVGVFLLFTLLQTGPLDQILRGLERIPGIKNIFALSFTKGFRRYLAPGFKGVPIP